LFVSKRQPERLNSELYQLDLTTPGICPCSASSRKQMRHRLNFRK